MVRSRGSDGCLKVSVRYPSLIGGLALAFLFSLIFYAFGGFSLFTLARVICCTCVFLGSRMTRVKGILMGVIVDHITRNWFPWRRGGVEICRMADDSLVFLLSFAIFAILGKLLSWLIFRWWNKVK